jgi:hypothetical protein
MEEIVIFSSILMAGLAALLLIVSVVSYLRMRTINMALLVVVFGIFILKGVLLIADIAEQSTGLVILDLFIIIFLYLTVARR